MSKKEKHPYFGTRLYNIWGLMKQRCNNPNNFAYKWYGERGITVCEEWNNNSLEFCEWAMNNGYKEGLELDRIDNNKGYSPDNCHWVTKSENISTGKRRSLKNTSGFAGVWYDISKGNKKWRTDIYLNNGKRGLGTYETFEEAVEARIKGEIEYFGERKTYM